MSEEQETCEHCGGKQFHHTVKCYLGGDDLKTDPMTPARLSEIRARAEAATAGPWYQGRDGTRFESAGEAWTRRDMNDPQSHDLFPMGARSEDAAFIAHSRQDVPDLLAEVDRLTTALAEARADAWDEGDRARLESQIKWHEPSSVERMYWPDTVNPYREAQK